MHQEFLFRPGPRRLLLLFEKTRKVFISISFFIYSYQSNSVSRVTCWLQVATFFPSQHKKYIESRARFHSDYLDKKSSEDSTR